MKTVINEFYTNGLWIGYKEGEYYEIKKRKLSKNKRDKLLKAIKNL